MTTDEKDQKISELISKVSELTLRSDLHKIHLIHYAHEIQDKDRVLRLFSTDRTLGKEHIAEISENVLKKWEVKTT